MRPAGAVAEPGAATGSDAAAEESFLPGDAGYWAHWWAALTAHDPATTGTPMWMDVVVADRFADRDWLAELDREILAAVVDGGLITGRVIVPPDSLDRPAEELLEVGRELGFEVRVLAGTAPFAVYAADTVVLPEVDAAGVAGHRRIHRTAVVRALQDLFALHWAAATPWDEHRRGAVGVLELLARGWSDAQVAAALGISPRTVSRRVAEAMTAFGARSRFELGVRVGLTRRG